MAEGHGKRAALAKFFRVVFGLVVLVAPALAIAFLVGSLILSGGKASDAMDTKWGVVVPYPMFTVPTVVLVALGVASIALALGVALTNRTVDELRVRRLIGPTLASAVCAFVLSLTSPEDPTRFNDGFIGTQWTASLSGTPGYSAAATYRRRNMDARPLSAHAPRFRGKGER